MKRQLDYDDNSEDAAIMMVGEETSSKAFCMAMDDISAGVAVGSSNSSSSSSSGSSGGVGGVQQRRVMCSPDRVFLYPKTATMTIQNRHPLATPLSMIRRSAIALPPPPLPPADVATVCPTTSSKHIPHIQATPPRLDAETVVETTISSSQLIELQHGSHVPIMSPLLLRIVNELRSCTNNFSHLTQIILPMLRQIPAYSPLLEEIIDAKGNNLLLLLCDRSIITIGRYGGMQYTPNHADSPLVDCVALLLDKGCNINFSNFDGVTPLLNAIYRNNKELVDFLLKNGADTESVYYRVSYNDDELIRSVTNALRRLIVWKYSTLGSVHSKKRCYRSNSAGMWSKIRS